MFCSLEKKLNAALLETSELPPVSGEETEAAST